MLLATLISLATFLLELCISSPVYNMQPAFITNSIGVTAGRNIRHLPCISRKNNNQNGVCMFAIDCMKANGTHLGTCIDRFYFGSCCHIEPVHEIIDNSIDTDILPHREPPLRVTSTTLRTTSSTPGSTVTKLEPSTTAGTTIRTTRKPVSSTTKPQPTPSTVVFGQKVTTTKTTYTTSASVSTSTVLETSTDPQKLQTFQVVNGNTPEELSTKGPTTTTTTTRRPVVSTSKPSTSKPTKSKPSNTSSPKPGSVKPSGKPTSGQETKPTVKPKPVRPSGTTVSPTRSPTKKPTSKPTGTTGKPFKPASTTKRPQPGTTSKVTKKPASTTPKPTKRPTTTKSTTPKASTTSKITTTKPTTSQSTTTVKVIKITSPTTPKPTTQTEPSATPELITLVPLPTLITRRPTDPTKPPVLTTSPSNEVTVSKGNQTVVSGNPATNEIEQGKPVGDGSPSEPTEKPSLVTWTIIEDRNETSSTQLPEVNATTQGWSPITPPADWVLLPNIPPSENTTSSTSTPSTSSPPSVTRPSEVEASSTASSVTQEKPVTTDLPVETTNISITSTTASEESEAENPVTSEAPSSETSSEGVVTSTEAIDRPVNMSDYRDVCGRRMYPEARIVGGEKSPFGKWPWQISLRQWRTSTYLHKCGAALLNENWAITAAHCVDNVPPSDLLLRLGEHDLSTESEPYLHQERRVQIVASHPQFDPRTFEYDLALLRFYEPVTFQPNILPVCVPQTDENFVGRTAHVTGWGRLYEDGPLPSILQEVSVPVINNTVCESMYRSAGYIEHIPHIFICAGWRRGGFDSCEGDSGGPMVIQREDKRFLLAGVISWGIGCAEPNQPGVYTRISEFRDWINQILQF